MRLENLFIIEGHPFISYGMFETKLRLMLEKTDTLLRQNCLKNKNYLYQRRDAIIEVVFIKKEFNAEMDKYIRSRLILKPKIKKRIVEQPDEKLKELSELNDEEKEAEEILETYPKSLLHKLFPFLEKKAGDLNFQEAEELPEINEESVDYLKGEFKELSNIEEEINIKKENLFSKMFGRLSFLSEENLKHEQPTLIIDEDMKQILRVTHHWLKKLSKEDLSKFKNSNDFEIYKSTLKKYNLIKER